MLFLNKAEHALVTVYGDNVNKDVARLISGYIPDKELRILTPGNPQTLEQAAQNSVLTFIGVNAADDPNLNLARSVRENRLVACDIIALCLEDFGAQTVNILSKGFDSCISMSEARNPDFRKYLLQKISSGGRRLSGLILEEEYRRVCDALSAAPASMIIFDGDKRAVFISDHYFRAYPRIASRLVRGLSVYDAFDMMAREEGLLTEDPLYEKLQRYWYTLEDSIEFRLASGISYRLKAVQLPNRRGTVLMAQNISGYEIARTALEEQTMRLSAELERIRGKMESQSE